MFTTLYAGSRRSQTHTYARSLINVRTLLATPYSFAPTTILMNSPGFGSGAGSVTVSPQA